MRLFRHVFLGVTLLFALPTSLGFAASEPRKNFPCPDCLFYPPNDPTKPSPLLIVLHGDAPGGKKPLVERDASPFVNAATERGIAVFAPRCPPDQGCKVGSFWQWTEGDPVAWLDKQIEIIRKDVAIDPDRLWIAGWSGGASFLGYRYPSLAGRYSAVAFAGGGMPPGAPACPPCSPPTYFMVGDKNPLHHLAKDLRKSVAVCSSDVTWDLLPGQDHGGEWRTLGRPEKIRQMLDWFTKHPRNCPEQSSAPAPTPSSIPSTIANPNSSSNIGSTRSPSASFAPNPSSNIGSTRSPSASSAPFLTNNTPPEPPRPTPNTANCAVRVLADERDPEPMTTVSLVLGCVWIHRRWTTSRPGNPQRGGFDKPRQTSP